MIFKYLTKLLTSPLLIHQKKIVSLIHFFKIQKIFSSVMRIFPNILQYQTIRYRIRSVESISIAQEIFFQPTYTDILDHIHVKTFIDLGCNTGFFSCLLANKFGSSDIHGLLVDGDQNMINESNVNLKLNNIFNCQTYWGVVGPQSDTVPFHISHFNISSSVNPLDNTSPLPVKTKSTIETPVIQLKDLVFHNFFQGQRIHLLKIDIEGSEIDILKNDPFYLEHVDYIIIEWHKWICETHFVFQSLELQHFSLISMLKDNKLCGLGFFQNKKII